MLRPCRRYVRGGRGESTAALHTAVYPCDVLPQPGTVLVRLATRTACERALAGVNAHVIV